METGRVRYSIIMTKCCTLVFIDMTLGSFTPGIKDRGRTWEKEKEDILMSIYPLIFRNNQEYSLEIMSSSMRFTLQCCHLLMSFNQSSY